MEIWKTIPDFENYEASNDGRIKRTKTQKILSQQIDNRGYKVITLYIGKKKYCKKVSRLIWSAFNDCQCAMTVDHIDRNKHNNVVSNLRCISNKDNCANRPNKSSVDSNVYNLTDNIKGDIMDKIINQKLSTHQIWLQYGIPTNYMGSVIKRGSWLKHLND